jgi:transcriptional regulator with XRE-family HTH domain
MKAKNRRGEGLKWLLGQNIKRFRGNLGYSQEVLAERAGISTPFLGAIERGDKWPSPATLAEIAHGLGVFPYDLLRPEKIASQDIKKITSNLVKDITRLVGISLKKINSVTRDND